ncbi:hypothetical protein SKAU_G00080100 [Synaphobranchus kaupii]|uniref:Uncharacterized protein n=1 Tax=Synaphobranchus kaupii TaxID=118154 RepID=A0A9Q1J4D8_SYNKA|nr:hypothetical protein SKAU_G00080100 [Synaphobranchus kaupii]
MLCSGLPPSSKAAPCRMSSKRCWRPCSPKWRACLCTCWMWRPVDCSVKTRPTSCSQRESSEDREEGSERGRGRDFALSRWPGRECTRAGEVLRPSHLGIIVQSALNNSAAVFVSLEWVSGFSSPASPAFHRQRLRLFIASVSGFSSRAFNNRRKPLNFTSKTTHTYTFVRE